MLSESTEEVDFTAPETGRMLAARETSEPSLPFLWEIVVRDDNEEVVCCLDYGFSQY